MPLNARTGASWMKTDAKKNALLYVSDLGTNDVYVYSYPQRKLEGTLSGFSAVHSGCVDAHGNVFITNSHDSEIEEFAHGGATPIATLDDGKYDPLGCSVDPKTGNLAVANVSPVQSSGSGNIAIYEQAQGAATYYADPNVYLYYNCAYDGKGTLYVTGGDFHGNFKFAKLARGSRKYTDLTLNQQINVPGGVQWDGKDVAVEDQGAGYKGSTVYRVKVSGSSATVVSTIALSGSTDVHQFWVYQHKLIGANVGTAPSVMFWKYPAGGTAVKIITGLREPDGVTVSPAE